MTAKYMRQNEDWKDEVSSSNLLRCSNKTPVTATVTGVYALLCVYSFG